MSETQTTARATRTKAAEPQAISDDLISRIIEVTERRAATRPNPMTLDTFEQIEAFAERASRSVMVPKDYQGKPDNIIIAVMKGKELGMPPIQALESIAIVNGRSSLWGAMVEGLCYASGLVEDHEEHFEGEEGTDAYTAVCTVKRRGIASPKIGRFSQGDAKRAGLFGQATHGKYPRRMMQWRAKHPAFNDAFPDVLKGIAIRELEAEDAIATPGWTMPQPEKAWFTVKPQAQSDGWDDTWFRGVVQKLANETNAWKWLDLLVACLGDAPALRDVNEIGDLPVVVTVRETAPEDGKQAIDQAFNTVRAKFAAKAKETAPQKTETTPVATETQATGEGPNPPVADPVPDSRLAAAVEAPPPEDRSTPTSPTSGGQAFSAWLMDGDGSELADEDGVIPTEPFTDPVTFARAYVDVRGNLFPADIQAFEAANKAGIAAAMIASTEVAPLLIVDTPTDPSLPMSMPTDPAFIALPSPIKMTKPTMTEFNKELEARVSAVTTLEGLDHIRMVNEPTYEAFAPSFRLAALALIDNRRREITPPPTGRLEEAMEQIAIDMVAEITSLVSFESCQTWQSMPAVKAKLADLEAGDPVRWRQVWAALRSTQLLCKVQACQTVAQLQAMNRDPWAIEQLRWLTANAKLVADNTAAAAKTYAETLKAKEARGA